MLGLVTKCVSIPNGMEFYPIPGTPCFAYTLVSIPNGMEFYTKWRAGRIPFKVSIPNGMEFYEELFSQTAPSSCFNSQRDGILRSVLIKAVFASLFQFPTGWNSTKCEDITNQSDRCFNSQRDGILRCSASIRTNCGIMFQFPTGWNSTLVVYWP